MTRAIALLALLVVACGGQVDDLEDDGPPVCHEVRGYFEDNRCSRPVVFDSCDKPLYAWTVRDFKCSQVTP